MRVNLKRLCQMAVALLLGLSASGASLAQTVSYEAARSELPEAMKDAGILKIATSLQWAPFAYKAESGEPAGIDIELLGLLADRLGLKAEFEDIKFPSIIPGINTGRYDAGVNELEITEDRLKAVDFVPYLTSDYGLLVRKGVDIDINDLCGRTLSLTQGSAQVTIAEELAQKCEAAGREPVALQFYPSSADTYLAVSNGRGDGFLTAKAQGFYISQRNDKLQLASGTLEGYTSVSGIAIGKGNEALRKALLLALESAEADGSYGSLLEKYGIRDSALSVDQMRSQSLP